MSEHETGDTAEDLLEELYLESDWTEIRDDELFERIRKVLGYADDEDEDEDEEESSESSDDIHRTVLGHGESLAYATVLAEKMRVTIEATFTVSGYPPFVEHFVTTWEKNNR